MTEPLDPRLTERLQSVADPLDDADWLDVRRRAQRVGLRRRRRRRPAILLAAALAVVLVVVIPAFGIGSRILEVLSLTETEAEVPRAPAAVSIPAYVYGDALYGASPEPQRLGGMLAAPLLGQHDVSLVVPSPDGRFVVYHSSKAFRPTTSLRVHDTQTGADRILARRAQSVAWRRDGRLAYWQARDAGYVEGRPYLGDVLVRRTLNARPQIWTPRVGEYTILGWARDRLLVRSRVCLLPGCEDVPRDGVYVLTAPNEMRPLPLSDVTAISPDGRHAIGRWLPVAGQDSPSPFVRVAEIRTGRVIAHVDLRQAVDHSIPASRVSEGIGKGSWTQDRIVATAYGEGGSRTLLLFRFADDRLTIERAFRLDQKVGAHLSFFSPVFTTTAGDRIVVHAVADDLAPRRVIFFASCELTSARCRRGKDLPPQRWLSLVYNPSRPARAAGLLPSRG